MNCSYMLLNLRASPLAQIEGPMLNSQGGEGAVMGRHSLSEAQP